MEKKIERLDDAQLEAKLAEVLGTWPLYREFRYTGSGFQYLPERVRFFCGQCGKEQTWEQVITRDQRRQSDRGFQQRAFRCRNCKEQILYFAYEWSSDGVEEADGKKIPRFVFRKYGQWPTLEEMVSPELEEALRGSDDLGFYKTALRLRNFGYGIGAMGYMRRVIENHMNEMLDILCEAKIDAPESLPDAEKIKTLRFADKLEQAAILFPKNLAPDGLPNPFKPLYVLTSDALHNLPEDEAVVLFDQCRAVFEQVFSNLRPHLRKSKGFVSSLRDLAEAAAKSKK
jgi:hypothetical protein